MAFVADAFSGRSNHQLLLEVNQTSQNIANNTSTVTWALYAERTSGVGSVSYDNVGSWYVDIDGVRTNGGGWNYDTRSNPVKQIASGTRVITHNTNGTQTTFFYAYANSASTLGSASANGGSLTHTTIPRASSITFSPSLPIAGQAMTITTNRASTGFTHTITYSFNGATGTVGTGVGASIVWTVPLSLLNQIPNAATGSGTITTKTYSGATLIGTTTRAFSVTAAADVKPTVAGITLSENVTLVATTVGAFVQTLSRLNFAMTGVAGAYGSTITAHQLTVAGQTFTTVSGVTAVIASPGTVPVVATVTDSRGRTATVTVNITVMAYAAPAIGVTSFQRALATGVVNDAGTTIRVNLLATVPSLINTTQRNALSYRISSRQRGTLPWTLKASSTPGGVSLNAAILVSTYDITLSWEVLIEVFDTFSSASPITLVGTIASGQVLMHWATAAVGIGKYAEQGQLDVMGQIFQNNGSKVVDEGGFTIATRAATAAPSTYPLGVSVLAIGVDSTWPTNYAAVSTHRVGPSRSFQIITEKHTGVTWVRAEGDFDLWSAFGAPFGGALPAPLSVAGAATQSITATAWTAVPNIADMSFTAPGAMIVDIKYGAWMTTTSDLRFGVRVTGAITVEENFPNWGAVAWNTDVPAGTARYTQRFASKTVTLPAGTSTIQARAYKGGASGNHQVNYSFMQATPLRWA